MGIYVCNHKLLSSCCSLLLNRIECYNTSEEIKKALTQLLDSPAAISNHSTAGTSRKSMTLGHHISPALRNHTLPCRGRRSTRLPGAGCDVVRRDDEEAKRPARNIARKWGLRCVCSTRCGKCKIVCPKDENSLSPLRVLLEDQFIFIGNVLWVLRLKWDNTHSVRGLVIICWIQVCIRSVYAYFTKIKKIWAEYEVMWELGLLKFSTRDIYGAK